MGSNPLRLMLLIAACLLVAAFSKAMSDTLLHHYDTSIFKSLDRNWWDPNQSWKHVGLIIGYRPDAWHLANSLMIVAFITPIALGLNGVYKLRWWLWLIILGLVFNTAFNLFYDKILR